MDLSIHEQFYGAVFDFIYYQVYARSFVKVHGIFRINNKFQDTCPFVKLLSIDFMYNRAFQLISIVGRTRSVSHV